MTEPDPTLQRENERREELNDAARAGRESDDPNERALWEARDNALATHPTPFR